MAVANPSGLKQYSLGTPHRRHISKAVARGHKKAVVDECFADPVLEKYIIQKIIRVVRFELKAMCSMHVNSVLRGKTNESLKNFDWHTYLTEIQSNAPVLHKILLGSAKKNDRVNKSGVIGMCIAILLKIRSNKMNLIHKIIGLILYTGHSGKQVKQNDHCLYKFC